MCGPHHCLRRGSSAPNTEIVRTLLQRYQNASITRMRRSLAKFSESEASNHTPSSADFTTTTPELKFSVHTTRFGQCQASQLSFAALGARAFEDGKRAKKTFRSEGSSVTISGNPLNSARMAITLRLACAYSRSTPQTPVSPNYDIRVVGYDHGRALCRR